MSELHTVRFLASIPRRIGGRGAWWTKIIRWVAFLGVAGVLAGAITVFVLYRAIGIPNPNADFETQTTKVYYSDGKHVIGTFAMQDRENVQIEEVPAVMQAAVIAAEDRTFYSNRGIDMKGILRALRDNTQSGQITGGGSTITQQYVKILYLNQERSYKRKVKEAILSLKIDNQQSKKQILEGYLNTIYFGNGAYGVEVASRTYFDRGVKDLSVKQAAYLATVLNNPTYYDAYADGAEQRILPRYQYVLDGMLKSGAISQKEHDEAYDKLPAFEKQKNNNRFGGTRGFLLSLVQKKLASLEFTDAQINGGGLRVVTTFDYNDQSDAVRSVKEQRPSGFKDVHQALVSIDPRNGAVRAMYGGDDFLKSQQNWALIGSQPGSTFKMFAVVAALQNGYSLQTRLNGNSPIQIGGDTVENQGDSGGSSFGQIPLSFATQESVNTAFVDLTEQMKDGPKKIKEAAADAGVPESVLEGYPEVPVTSLGVERVPVVDMANAYATIANKGKRNDWFVIDKVTDNRDASLYEHKTRSKRTISADVAADTTSALQGVVRAGSGTNAATRCPTAGKTGTATATSSGSSRQHVSSSWFIGYTPKLVTAVMYNRGVGNEALDGYLPTFYGGQYPAKTFGAYMGDALGNSSCGSFPAAANIQATEGTQYVRPAESPKTTRPTRRPTTAPTTTPPTTTTPPDGGTDGEDTGGGTDGDDTGGGTDGGGTDGGGNDTGGGGGTDGGGDGGVLGGGGQ